MSTEELLSHGNGEEVEVSSAVQLTHTIHGRKAYDGEFIQQVGAKHTMISSPGREGAQFLVIWQSRWVLT